MNQFDVTLDNCDQEPIHIPNLIQPNGFLMVVRINDKTIIQVSENIEHYTGLPTDGILEKPLSKVFPNIYTALRKNEKNFNTTLRYDAFSVATNKRKYVCVPHSFQQNTLILEFEHFGNKIGKQSTLFLQQLNAAILEIQELYDHNELVKAVAKIIRMLTGYDRVMVYKFDQDYNGDIIAEEKTDKLYSFLHHKFPASDIPKQARELYLKNWVRIINDVDYVPVPLIPAINAVTGQFIDLSKSFLRSVSPIHIEYLKNMGVMATLTISIVTEGKLWGLIACHHYQAKYISYDQRMGIEFFGKVLSHKWQMIDSKKVSKHINESQNLGAKLLSAIRSSSDLNETLIDFTDELLGIAAGDGLLIKYDDTILRLGNVPDDNFCLALMEWLLKQHSDNTFYTYELHKHFPAAEQMAASASGILTVGFGVLNPCRIIWFRSEFVQSLDWGGNPNEKTLIMLDKDSYRLSPRKSFDKWTQAIKNRSKDWEVYHIEAANLFKSTFTEILAWRNAIYKQQNNLLELEVAKKAEEITGLYEQLLAQYNKLEAAAFEQSHVIRAPLSTMMGLLNLLKSETEQEEIMYIYGKLQEKMELLDQIIINTTRKLE